MSKGALQKIANEIKATTAKTVREGFLNRQVHVFSINESMIGDEIASEISYRDEVAAAKDSNYQPILDQVSPQTLDQAAKQFFLYLTQGSKLAAFYDRTESVFTVNKGAGTYRLISDELTIASALAIDLIEAKTSIKTNLKAGQLIQFDHNNAVANVRTAYALSKSKEGQNILNKLFTERRISEDDYDVYTSVLSYYNAGTKTLDFSAKVVQGSLESGGVNASRGNTVELSRRGAILRAMDKLILSKDLGNLKSSDSYIEYLKKRVNNAAVKSGANGQIKTPQIANNSAAAREKVKTKVQNAKLPTIVKKRAKVSTKVSNSRLDLKTLINAKLNEVMVSNMGPGSLVNRTGRLAASARVTAQNTTKTGFTSLDFTYQRAPYDVFDPVLGAPPWNKPGRSPRALVEKSIREIAAEYTRDRFYLRRV